MQKFTEDQKDFLRILGEYSNIKQFISDIDANKGLVSQDSLGGGGATSGSSSSRNIEDSLPERIFSQMSEKHTILYTDFRMVMSIAISSNGDLAFSGLDGKFKTNKVSLIGNPNNEYVRISDFLDEKTLISGSSDSTIKIWDLPTGSCTKTLIGHNNGVFYLKAINKELLVSIDYDNY